MNRNRNRLLLLAAALVICSPADAKKEKVAPGEPPPAAKKVKPDTPECIACCKEASKLFATGKSTDALKILKANQATCKDSARFNLLMSTILLRMPSHEKEAAGFAATASDLDPTSIPAAFQLGVCHTASGDSKQAAEAYERVVKLDPANYEAWSALGGLYEQLHDQQRAKTSQAKAAALEPGSRIAKIRTAQNLFKQGKPAAVAAELERLMADDHMEPEFLVGLAKDALDMQSFAESIKAADRALATYPNLTELLKTKSTAQLWKRRYEDGLETISKVDANSRDNTDVIAIKSLHLLKLGRTKEAQPLVSKLPKSTTEAPLAALARAYMAERTGDTNEAVKQLESALRHNQVFAPPHIELARLYLRQGRLEDVISETHEIQRSKPFAASGKAFESRLALEEAPLREKVAEALRLGREAVKLDGEDPEALVALALSDLKGGKLEEAQESIKKAMEIEPGHVDALLANAKILEGEAKKRTEALENLREIAPGDTEVIMALAQAHADSGDLTSAIKLLREQIEEGSGDPSVMFALARVYERSGRSKEAAKYFKQSLTDGLTGQKASLAREALKNLGNQPPEEI